MEMHEGYAEITHPSVYLRLPLKDRPGEYLLVWTTTPWTLAANVAAAVHPGFRYAACRQGDDVYYVVESRTDVMKEKGPFEVTGRVMGRDMVGWAYSGAFDELEAVGAAGVPDAHRIIPWTEVTDREGTGIVHIAPGCGREDYGLSRELELPVLAPIDESGNYYAGYGPFAGRSAPTVDEDVFASLREKGLYYKTEPYAHNYPHCWRCKEPLLFRNVDEWYIDMSWRDEIAEVARKITWIPAWGLARELDWLKNMGDWMISKKRYWGLALPIWTCECGWFDVIGSKAELQERAVEGWNEFEGHTPHRPWVDAVKIRCEGCGKPAARIPEVGNPWLDAGIVPYSTVGYTTDREYWKQWIPAGFITECFPGQFRNWFYALLAMSTMMEGIPPFKTLLGHASVKDELGREMHKSLGNAIPFDEAAEKMSADVMRWMFCRQDPVNDVLFGYKAGREVERKVFGTWWNVYGFFANYARLDGFNPATPKIPPAERPELDRWILSELSSLVALARTRYPAFEVAAVVRRAEDFVEELSNWYVRRNRRRFWRPRDASDTDKLAAYQTLYECLVTLAKVLAPVIPFFTERLYQNLVRSQDPSAPVSVHLVDFPEADESLIDENLSAEVGAAMRVVSAGLGLRETRQVRVRQPLSRIMVVPSVEADRRALDRLADHIREELNVKAIEVLDALDEVARPVAKPNFKNLGPKFGPRAKAVAEAVPAAADKLVKAFASGESCVVEVGGADCELTPEDVTISRELPGDLALREDGPLAVVLDFELTPELVAEGLARDVVRHVQELRKDSGLEMSDRIALAWESESEEIGAAIESWDAYIKAETLAESIDRGIEGPPQRTAEIGGSELALSLRKV
jgi:isoleucyl-tRNA synthetase